MDLKFLSFIPLCIVLCGCSRAGADAAYEGLTLCEAEPEAQEYTASDIGDAREEGISDNIISNDIYVYICGQVYTPGVYGIEKGARIYQVIELAGGLRDEADINSINQAAECSDGEMIYIPAVGEDTGHEAYGTGDARININTADAGELQEINGIGSSRAQDIISYRENNGKFTSVEDIMKVPGIKQGMYDKIKDQIRV